MDDVVSDPDHPLLRRRNSISAPMVVVPVKPTLLSHHNSTTSTATTNTTATSSSFSFPSDDLEPTAHSYTSLKDLLPSVAVNSPKPNSAREAHPGSDICIRNRLVKHAAWAYLQPMSTSPGSAGDGFIHRLWPRVAAFFGFVCHNVMRAVNCTLRFIWIRSSR